MPADSRQIARAGVGMHSAVVGDPVAVGAVLTSLEERSHQGRRRVRTGRGWLSRESGDARVILEALDPGPAAEARARWAIGALVDGEVGKCGMSGFLSRLGLAVSGGAIQMPLRILHSRLSIQNRRSGA